MSSVSKDCTRSRLFHFKSSIKPNSLPKNFSQVSPPISELQFIPDAVKLTVDNRHRKHSLSCELRQGRVPMAHNQSDFTAAPLDELISLLSLHTEHVTLIYRVPYRSPGDPPKQPHHRKVSLQHRCWRLRSSVNGAPPPVSLPHRVLCHLPSPRDHTELRQNYGPLLGKCRRVMVWRWGEALLLLLSLSY